MADADLPVSELVAQIRAERRLTQEGLARELGVSFSTVNAWEAGRSQPKPRHLRRLEDLAAESAGPDPAEPDAVHVLCVDDSPVDLELLASHVRDAGAVLGLNLKVITETDAMRALITLGRVEPTVAFVDIVMPGLDGFTLADRIREMPDVRIGRLVLVTAQRDEGIDAKAAERGLLVLDKPISIGDVGTALRQGGVSLAQAG